MASASESSDEFFDAEEIDDNIAPSLGGSGSKKRSPKTHTDQPQQQPSEPEFRFPDAPPAPPAVPSSQGLPRPTTVPVQQLQPQQVLHHGRDENKFVEPQTYRGRQRFRDLRQCMQNDEDENPGNTLTPDSQTKTDEKDLEYIFAIVAPKRERIKLSTADQHQAGSVEHSNP
ncbi:hypothetical protein pipiens_018067 [Culex pipiens pipiens]|uniref:Uncharacterized protein n=1 Tax=Culex pipiens pipiens TaxID=38569 RepID=A0ABD1CDL6_CULPP